MDETDKINLYRTFYILGDSACLKILFEIDVYGEKNFSELRNSLGINPTTLSKKLKLLSDVALITADKSRDQLRVYYSLHENQRSLRRVLDSLERISKDL